MPIYRNFVYNLMITIDLERGRFMSTTALKIFALILMLIDHIGQFIPGAPIWFNWLGRIAAPLFIFAVVWGFTYTSNRKKYCIRLYVFSLVVAFMNLTINMINNEYYNYLENNFITPLFLIVFILYMIEKKDKKLYIAFGVWQVVSFFLIVFLVDFLQEVTEFRYPFYPLATVNFYNSLFGNIFAGEGGVLFILLGVGLYLLKDNKIKLSIFYIAFSGLIYVLIRKFGYMRGIIEILVAFGDYQWMMIAALPFMLLYNGKKGMGLKYFFYVFYPLHIAILYIIGQMME